MRREIHLSGGEITLLKTLGLSGAPTPGQQLVERIGDLETAELLDVLNGLISTGYVLSNKLNARSIEDVTRASFRVNPSYAHDLREAVSPGRRREQDRSRRRRRRG